MLVVQTVGYRIVYVLFFIQHNRRQLVHFNVTSHPTAAWIWQQLLEATPGEAAPTPSSMTVTRSKAETSRPGCRGWASSASGLPFGRRGRMALLSGWFAPSGASASIM